MVFLGDIATPLLLETERVWDCSAIANLEGQLTATSDALIAQPLVYNDLTVVDYLHHLNVRAVSLANNHITDLPQPIATTQDALTQAGIQSFGAGETLAVASQPAHMQLDGRQCILLGYGWSTVGCRPATANGSGVSPLSPSALLGQIEKAKADNPDSLLIAFVHWNYELELYPQPMHRQLAFAAIEAGASAVIGAHPHCVGGIETYKGAPIVYSLGNWCFPQGVFWGGRLTFPDSTLLQLALEWNPASGEISCHWFKYHRKNHEIRYLNSERTQDSQTIAQLTPFAGYSHAEYTKWFRQHRTRKRGLPIYYDYRNSMTNSAKDAYLSARQWAADTTFHLGLRERSK